MSTDDQQQEYQGVAVASEGMELFLASAAPLLASKFYHIRGNKVVPSKNRLAYVGK